MSTILPVFRCPSDPGNPTIPADTAPPSPLNYPVTPIFAPSSIHAGAKTSYDFVTSTDGETTFCNFWSLIAPMEGGQVMFGQNSNCPIARVTDGMSNTFLLAETCFEVHSNSCQAWGYRSWLMTGISPGAGINRWWPQTYGTLEGIHFAGSLHPGGCGFAMGDGAVRFVSQGVSVRTLYVMSTIADGDIANIE
jgi:hypothetical protein